MIFYLIKDNNHVGLGGVKILVKLDLNKIKFMYLGITL